MFDASSPLLKNNTAISNFFREDSYPLQPIKITVFFSVNEAETPALVPVTCGSTSFVIKQRTGRTVVNEMSDDDDGSHDSDSITLRVTQADKGNVPAAVEEESRVVSATAQSGEVSTTTVLSLANEREFPAPGDDTYDISGCNRLPWMSRLFILEHLPVMLRSRRYALKKPTAIRVPPLRGRCPKN